MLFTANEEQHPQLRPLLGRLQQGHSMIGHLIGGLEAAVGRRSSPELERHLDGLPP